jgi:hypothetical protein
MTNKNKGARGRPVQTETLVSTSIRLRPDHVAWLKADRANLELLRAWLDVQAGLPYRIR